MSDSNLEEFVSKIDHFEGIGKGELIVYLSFFLLYEQSNEVVTPQKIARCFEELRLPPYSNISLYLKKNSTGKNCRFMKTKDGYVLTRQASDFVKSNMIDSVRILPTNELIDLSIFGSCPYYIQQNAIQMAQCYTGALYDACLVMMRKLIETLIIECFEAAGKDEDIKDPNGDFYFLSGLISAFEKSSSWNLSRNCIKNIQAVKKYGDLSAHNRRFLAKKSDIDSFKFDLSQVVREIILLIDYN